MGMFLGETNPRRNYEELWELYIFLPSRSHPQSWITDLELPYDNDFV